jgi:hypothetical protein
MMVQKKHRPPPVLFVNGFEYTNGTRRRPHSPSVRFSLKKHTMAPLGKYSILFLREYHEHSLPSFHVK